MGRRSACSSIPGRATSIVGLRAAASAGVKPGDPGVEPRRVQYRNRAQARPDLDSHLPTLKIGDEEIHNARLRFGDLGTVDMLLGDDFFLSHRVYVANSQHKSSTFTYNWWPRIRPEWAQKGFAAATAAQPATEGDAASSGTRNLRLNPRPTRRLQRRTVARRRTTPRPRTENAAGPCPPGRGFRRSARFRARFAGLQPRV